MRQIARSVRFRITVTATAIVALALLAAAWGLVRVVESTLEDRVQETVRQRAASAVERLQAGVAPERLVFAPGSVFVQVLSPDGDVVAVSPGAPAVSVRRTIDLGNGYTLIEQRVQAPRGAYTVVAAGPLDDVRRAVDTLERVLRTGIPLLVLAVGTLAWVVVGRSLDPIEHIRAEVEAISSSTLQRRVPVPGTGDEVERLARTMNGMLDRLEGAAARQRRFVSDASHELRSPLATMRTELEVALAHPDRADWPRVAADVLADNARLEALVGDLLELARLDEGAAPVPASDVDLDDVVVDEATRPRAVPVDASGVHAARVAGDRAGLARVVRNLLDNAARHASSRVWVATSRDGDDVVLTVDDDGPGVPEAERERIFERFTRADAARARSGGGVGLGLAVVRAIVERHGGTVRAGDRPGGGARFTVRLPATGRVAEA